MNDLNEVLRLHKRRYPDMTAQDYMKLAYQRAFGCGHFVSDVDACRARLEAEYMDATPGAALFEPLGGGFSRLYLGNAREMGVSPRLLARLFFVSAARRPDGREAFSRSVEQLKPYADAAEIDRLLAEAIRSNFAPFSHSARYRAAYHTAYRVVSADYERLLPLMDAMEKASDKQPIAVALDGRCGAGKTTLAAKLSEVFECPVVSMDDFFLPPAMRAPERLNEPGGNVHIERFVDEVAPFFGRGEPFAYGVFDCGVGRVTRRRSIPEHSILIVEGSYALHPRIAGRYDVKAFCDIGRDAQRARLAARDPERLGAFIARWIPMEEKYFDTFDIRKQCDFILA